MAAVTSLRSAMIPRSQMQTRRKSIIELHGIPPILRPLLRAYFLGYASAVAPRILTLLMQYITRKRRKTATENGQCIGFVTQLRRIVLAGLDPQRFPTFCALIVGGSTLLEVCLLDTETELNVAGVGYILCLHLKRIIVNSVAPATREETFQFKRAICPVASEAKWLYWLAGQHRSLTRYLPSQRTVAFHACCSAVVSTCSLTATAWLSKFVLSDNLDLHTAGNTF